MAIGHSMTHARLMGAISRKRDRQSALFGPSWASRSGGFFVVRSRLIETSRRKPERETRIPGLAPAGACPEARGLSEGTRRKPDTDDRANPQGVRGSGAVL